MSTCTEFEAWMQELAAGTAAPEVEEAARRHVRECRECAAMLRLHEELLTLEAREELVPEEALRRARRGVLSALAGDARRGVGRSPTVRRMRRRSVPAPGGAWWRSLLTHPAAAGALAAVLVVAAFAAGALLPRTRQNDDAALGAIIQRSARRSTQLADVENSRYQFSNVSFRDADASRIGLSFDVTTHVEVAAERSDPLVKALLIQSLLNPSPVGNRLKAMEFAEELKDTAVKQALIVAMQNDSSVAVRLKAQSVLSSYPLDEEIQAAYLQVLRADSSVEMRLQAIEYFMNKRVRPDALRDVLRDLRAKDDTPVLLRASRYVQ